MATIPTAELLKAQSLIFSDVFSFIATTSVKCAVELGIADALDTHGQPMTLPDLASKLSLPASKTPHLRRLLRLLVHKGYFAQGKAAGGGGEDTYSLAPASQLLVKSNPTSFAPYVMSLIDSTIQSPLYLLGQLYRHDGPSTTTELMTGKTLWEWASENPELNQRFNQAMASDSTFTMKLLVTQCKDAFQGLRSLVDAGGGNGTSVRAIVEAFPAIRSTLLDLPHVVATVPPIPGVDAVGGDMFVSIPPADAVFLKTILHDWDDEKCVQILKRCKEAIPSKEKGGKVIIVDIVLDDGDKDPASSRVQILWDMMMVADHDGMEREEYEWKKIFVDAGFSSYKITPLGVRSLIEVFP